MKHLLSLAVVCAALSPAALAAPSDKDGPAKAALARLNEFIGSWKGPVGSETMTWGWNFKSPEPAIAFEAKGGKNLEKGEFRYLAAKKKYELKMTPAGAKEPHVFEGTFNKSGYLVLTREDPKTGDTQQLTFNTVGDEAERFIYKLETKPKGRSLFAKQYQVGLTREGVTFGPGQKKPECVVTGGLGTMQVAYMGKTFWVCCSGCKDAFDEDPAKYVKAFEAKNKK